MTTDRVTYAHQITVCPPSFETLKTSLDWKKIARTRTSSELVTVVVYSSEKKEERRKKKLFFQMLFAFCLGRLSTVRCGAARQSVNGGGGRGGGVGNGERRFVNPLSIGVLVVILPLFPRSDEFFTGFACCYIYWLKFVTSMLSSFEMTYLPSIRVSTRV